MAQVRLAGIDKFYGSVQALFDVSLEIEEGEFVVFVGPSGCGKSTLLRCVAGLEGVASGAIYIGDEEVTGTAPSDRGVAMVFQSYALYPHMSVRQNMEFGMKINGVAADERARRVAEAAHTLQLDDYLDRKPGQLSGGQRQRVAIGRAIVKSPKVFLFDEPLSNLDAKLRIQMRVELEALHRELGSTMIYVTHDQVEAMTMADKIVVLNGGRVEQVGAPLELYHKPKTEFVAGFIGSPSMNFLDVVLEEAGARYGDTLVPLSGSGAKDAARLGIRPEHLVVSDPDRGQIRGEILVKESLGGESYLHVNTAGGDRVVVKTDGDTALKAGEAIGLSLPEARVHIFAADGQSISA
ncbi:MAG: sn-glycerol-3-phosphate ABC transporter ATP-binding protein UgpC [Kiloniellales bacterium]